MAGSWSRTFGIAKDSLREILSSKVNLFFMSFGLIVGICAMVSIYSLGKGAEITVYRILENLNFGSNAFLILAGGGKFFGPAATRMDRFKMEDEEAIERFDFVVEVSPVQLGFLSVASPKNAVNTRVLGVLPVYSRINNWGVWEGRFINHEDVRLKRKVCVLGYDTAKNLLGDDPIGKRVRINGVLFEVVGVLEKKGVIGRFHLDERVLIPLSTARDRIFNRDWLNAAKVLLKSNVDFKRAERAIRNLLRKRHNLLRNEPDDFRIITPDQVMEFLTKATRTLTALLLSISLITLVVSGVIIMNIMYAIVEEKKKIIALRKAYGATNRDILFHYTFMTAVVAFLGGTIGSSIGNAIVAVVSSYTPIDGYYSVAFSVLCVLVAVIASVLFGTAPAKEAAKLPPAEILR